VLRAVVVPPRLAAVLRRALLELLVLRVEALRLVELRRVLWFVVAI
jgi:hypothetical protein